MAIEERQKLREEKSLPKLGTLHNWLFTGSERAGERAATIQTLYSASLNSTD